ncbi:MAG: glycosyltransferase family 2 protein [Acidobacteria bacterium]|nr:glycosyltransferase family 2 protein [Acidobacteriota bacterium]
MATLTAIIPSYGYHHLTEAAVVRLGKQTLQPDEIIVVDDGAGVPFAGTPGARIIRHTENRGFAAAVNSGIQAARTELVAVLNNDVVLADNWLERLAHVISARQSDFVCGKLYQPDGTLDGTFDLLCRGGLAWRVGAGRADGAVWSKAQTISFTSFTATLLRTGAFQEVGVLDESYHSYYEDVEWSLRAALAGKTGYFEPQATGIHTGSVTAGVWSYYSARQLLRNHRRIAYQYLLPDFGREYRIARTLLRAHCLNHGQWPDVPPESIAAKARGGRLLELLHTSEEQLYTLQAAQGMDRLWRWYFQLAGRMG